MPALEYLVYTCASSPLLTLLKSTYWASTESAHYAFQLCTRSSETDVQDQDGGDTSWERTSNITENHFEHLEPHAQRRKKKEGSMT